MIAATSFCRGWAFGAALMLFSACHERESHANEHAMLTPRVTEGGDMITFFDTTNFSFIRTEGVSTSSIDAEMTFPARVSAISVASEEGAQKNIILFENPDLAASYTALVQHLITINQIQNVNIRQRRIELERTKDLAENGAATGKDVLEAETALSIERTNLDNERASLIEHETRLKLGGFDPDELLDAPVGKTWIICDVPENMIASVSEGSRCGIQFSSFPLEKFEGHVDEIGDVVDNSTRMIKLRISVSNPHMRLKAGMFGTVSFGTMINNTITVPQQSVVTVQNKSYVFVKTDNMRFKRRHVITGAVIGSRMIIVSGLKPGDQVVSEGTMQLKGLSFGY